MFETVAASLIIGMLMEMRIQQGRLARKLVALKADLDEHREETGMHPIAHVAIIAFISCLALLPISGCARYPMPAFQEIPKNIGKENSPPGNQEGEKNVEKKPQRERAEDATYFWAKVGISVNAAIIIICTLVIFFAPLIKAQAAKLALWSMFLLGCSITAWVLAPAAIYIMYCIAALNLFMLGLFIKNNWNKVSAHA